MTARALPGARMKPRRTIRILLLVVLAGAFLIATVGGCDTASNGQATAKAITDAIAKVCGTTESREAGGPRTITPIDLDGSGGPTGYLVTCVNGGTKYVKATK